MRQMVKWICLAIIITCGSFAIPYKITVITWQFLPDLGRGNYFYIFSLLYGLMLISRSSERSGICIGNIRKRYKSVLLACGLPIVLTLIVYPFLKTRPFSGAPIGMWLISPLAEDLVFLGYLYGRFDKVKPINIHRRIPIRMAVVIGGIFFSASHATNLFTMNPGYVIFQMLYTFSFFMFWGLSRQWTGSIAYGTISHMVVNYIAWVVN